MWYAYNTKPKERMLDLRNIYDITNLIPSLMDEILSFFAYDFEKEHPERMERKLLLFSNCICTKNIA